MGSTPSVVLIHGLIGSLNDPTLLENFSPSRALAPDLLGYGKFAATSPDSISVQSQADHVHRAMTMAGIRKAHLVGHSVGWIVAAILARRYPQSVVSLVSVEGNFTLRDAFWTSAVARMRQGEVENMLNGFRADPAEWLRNQGIAPTPAAVSVARTWLAHQPASTLHAMAKSVIETTSSPLYANLLRDVLASWPFHLIAGERSHNGWDVPDWAASACASRTVIPGCGHLMMLEDPQAFTGATVEALSKP